MHWAEIPIYVIDFEGTRKSGVLEFGVVSLLGGEIVQAQTQLCSAQGPIGMQETREHGLDEEALVGKPAFLEYFDLFFDLRKKGVFAAHHAAVEEKLLKHYWPYPPQVPNFLESGQSVCQWGGWVDTYQLYRRLYPNLNSHNIMDLVACFGQGERLSSLAARYCPQQRSRAHCALFDALASAVMLMHLAQEPGFEEMSLEWLLIQSAPSSAKKSLFEQKGLF